MTTICDVAKYILEKLGPVSAMKLQKLCYYSQAWSLVWDEAPLFDNRFEAWANGPVSPLLYDKHKGLFEVAAANIPGDASALSPTAIDTIDRVLKFYGDKTAQWLSDLTHQEQPWVEARGDLAPTARSNNEITIASMGEYYSGI